MADEKYLRLMRSMLHESFTDGKREELPVLVRIVRSNSRKQSKTLSTRDERSTNLAL